MAQDKKPDAVEEAYSNQGGWRWGGEKNTRDTATSIQGVRKLGPEEYQKKVNEDKSSAIASRQAYLASIKKRKSKVGRKSESK